MASGSVMRRTWVAIVLGMLGATLLLASTFTPKASATEFCTNVWLAPYGQGGDRCWGPSIQGLSYGAIRTFTRAGCVDIADGNNNLLESWVCGAAGSAPSLAAEIWYQQDFTNNHKAVIRNNNLSFSAQFQGTYACSYSHC